MCYGNNDEDEIMNYIVHNIKWYFHHKQRTVNRPIESFQRIPTNRPPCETAVKTECKAATTVKVTSNIKWIYSHLLQIDGNMFECYVFELLQALD